MQRKKLPIGIQTFGKIREPRDNFIYVDKTEMAYFLAEKPGYYFLSRPRRFGKSLFLDTLSEIFKGSKELFKGLCIYDKWDWAQQFPVIRFDFTSGGFSSQASIVETLKTLLEFNCESFGIKEEDVHSNEPGLYFQKLVRQVHKQYQQKVVILIDEYDKPILDNIGKEDKTMALVARELLRSFYSAIKASDRYLRFVFINGVSKFSKLNLFSGLNNIEDITIDANYATITGYTHNDLETHFKDYLAGVDLEAVKRWYNGYNYFGDPVYNPFDILLFFSKGGEFRNYWWETGNPSFLVQKLKEGDYFLPQLENIEASNETLNAFDVEHIDLAALLWQTGYLTFDKKVFDDDVLFYKMRVPNLEVQNSLNALFFDYLTNLNDKRVNWHLTIKKAMRANDFEGIQRVLEALFASIPYENYVKNNVSNYEGYYASVIYAFLCSLGWPVVAEDTTDKGRVDLSMHGPNSTYLFEFKVDQPAEAALHQIETKKYYQKYLGRNKEIYLVGINFSSKEKNIASMEWKKVGAPFNG